MPNTLTSLGLVALVVSGAAICTAIAAGDVSFWPATLVAGVLCVGMGLRQPRPAVGASASPGPRYVALAAVTIVMMPVLLWLIFGFAPQETTMGLAQKIFYFHVPSAYAMYVAFATALVGSVGYLWKRTERWDAIAVAGSEIGLLFCAIVLVTGPLWARKAWGVYWSWDPQLTVTLLAGLIFTGAVVLRSFGSGDAEKRFASGLAIVGAFLAPIIHYSVRRWRGQHPTVVRSGGGGLHPDMRIAFFVGLGTFTLLVAYLIWTRYRLERDRQALAELTSEASEAGLLEDA